MNLRYAGAEFLTCILREQQAALAVSLATASDGGPGQIEASGTGRGQWHSQSHLLFPLQALTRATGSAGM